MAGKLLPFLLFFTFLTAQSQDLRKHHWEDRIVLLISDSLDSDTLKKQLQLFQEAEQALKERKIVVYQISSSQVKRGINKSSALSNGDLYKRYNKSDAPFEVVLIGLDGGVKLRKERIVKPPELFELIDQMPMRRAELYKGKSP